MTAPHPEPDALSRPFFEGLAEGRLSIQRCRACETCQLGQDRCLACRSEDLAWLPASGEGVVQSYAVMHTVFHPAFAGEVPYVVARVELDEGPWLLARLRGVQPAETRIGLRVRAGVVELAPGAFAPVFEPLPGAR